MARIEQSGNAYRVLLGPEGKRLLKGPRRRWEDKIKMDLRDGCCELGTGQTFKIRDQWRTYISDRA